PLADELLAVARDARRLVDDRGARLGQPVYERGLADVRKADDRNRPEQRALARRRRGCLTPRTVGAWHRSPPPRGSPPGRRNSRCSRPTASSEAAERSPRL